MDNRQNILYIGPYNEESNRGKSALANIKGLLKYGHNLKIVPVYYPQERFKDTPKDLLGLEINDLDYYDICIQHCDALEYAFNDAFKKNIGIFNSANISHDPILNSRFRLLDNIIVNSRSTYNNLKNVLSKPIFDNIKYCPKYVDINHIQNYKKEKLNWTEDNRYYFYTELEFTEEYDWQNIIYTYVTTFMKKNCGLIIKTYGIDNKDKAEKIRDKIHAMTISANIKPTKGNMPRVLNGIFEEETVMKVYNSIDCFIDCNRSNDYNHNIFLAAALGKSLICNNKLAASEFFSSSYLAKGMPCNINHNFNNDIIASSMYQNYYSMECNSLRETMLDVYINRHNPKTIDQKELDQYDISHINDILC